MKEKLILGTANFGMNYGIANGKRLDDSTLDEVLSLASDEGFWGIDTANAYGDAELRIGQFFERNGKTLKVITKLTERDYPSEETVEKEIEAALTRMHIDFIDVLLIHSHQTYRQYGETVLPVLRRLCREKVIGEYGVSLYRPQEMKVVVEDTQGPMAFEIPLNLFDRRFIDGPQLQDFKTAGHHFFARSIFLQGLFFIEPKDCPLHFSSVKDRLMKMKAFSDDAGLEPESLPLLFALSHPHMDGVILGVDHLAHLRRNIDAISNGQLAAFESLTPQLESFRVEDEAITVPSNWPKS